MQEQQAHLAMEPSTQLLNVLGCFTWQPRSLLSEVKRLTLGVLHVNNTSYIKSTHVRVWVWGSGRLLKQPVSSTCGTELGATLNTWTSFGPSKSRIRSMAGGYIHISVTSGEHLICMSRAWLFQMQGER